MTEVRITMSDLRQAGHCAPGVRDFFKKHNCDLRKLAREGLTMEDVAHIRDANLDRVIQIAEERVRRG